MASQLHIVAYALAVVMVILLLAYQHFLVPPKHPVGIPAIPFWVTLLPLFTDIDQEQLYRTYIQKPLYTHGAVKIFFASQWNILVHRPAYMADILKREDAFRKSGNNVKIPHSVLASFVGENIIASHGKNWRTFRDVIQPGLQRTFDHGPLLANARQLCHLLCHDQASVSGQGIPVQNLLQRYTISNMANVLLETDFGTLKSHDAYLNSLQSRIKREIFRPMFMTFPVLDHLRLPSREKTRKLATHFTDLLVAGVESSASNRKLSGSSHILSDRLVAARSFGQLSEQQFRNNITISFVAGQENPQLALLSILYLLAKYPKYQDDLYDEITRTGTDEPSQEVLSDMPLLNAVIFECLRLMPPIGQLINRRAATDLMLGSDLHIPEGTYLGYNCFSTNRDPDAWGPDAESLNPLRWGSTSDEIQKNWRRRCARAELITFHGGRRACLGERFAILEIKVTLFVLIKTLEWKLDPKWKYKVTPVSKPVPSIAFRGGGDDPRQTLSVKGISDTSERLTLKLKSP